MLHRMEEGSEKLFLIRKLEHVETLSHVLGLAVLSSTTDLYDHCNQSHTRGKYIQNQKHKNFFRKLS
jgi:hypothetical protein